MSHGRPRPCRASTAEGGCATVIPPIFILPERFSDQGRCHASLFSSPGVHTCGKDAKTSFSFFFPPPSGARVTGSEPIVELLRAQKQPMRMAGQRLEIPTLVKGIGRVARAVENRRHGRESLAGLPTIGAPGPGAVRPSPGPAAIRIRGGHFPLARQSAIFGASGTCQSPIIALSQTLLFSVFFSGEEFP